MRTTLAASSLARSSPSLLALQAWGWRHLTSQARAANQGEMKRGIKAMQANGNFEVKIDRQPDPGTDTYLSRMTIDKQFHGDLEAHSVGQMLAAGTEVKGSAGYVAIEKVTGILGGRSGSFILQHNATMNRGAPQLNIVVVPDSGTAELVGLTGTMNIIIADGKHSYEFDYELAAK
jgi:hypothetical protein